MAQEALHGFPHQQQSVVLLSLPCSHLLLIIFCYLYWQGSCTVPCSCHPECLCTCCSFSLACSPSFVVPTPSQPLDISSELQPADISLTPLSNPGCHSVLLFSQHCKFISSCTSWLNVTYLCESLMSDFPPPNSEFHRANGLVH